ncbi:unnamed protein product [Rhodiola kirilowii]
MLEQIVHSRRGAQNCYVMEEGRPARDDRVLCCGCGQGWILFILDFIFGAIPWYAGRNREKPAGYIACDIKKQCAVFDAKVVSSIRTGPVKGRKKA